MTYLLDSNVISEVTKAKPDPAVGTRNAEHVPGVKTFNPFTS